MIPKADWEFDLRDETERKCIETLEGLMHDYERGAITTEAYRVALRAMNSAWRGLIDQDINFAIDGILTELGEGPVREVALFSLKGKLLVAERCDDVVSLRAWPGGNPLSISNMKPEGVADDLMASKIAFDSLIQKLSAKCTHRIY